MRARFIGGAKDEQVVEGIPEPPPGRWSDADGDYELFAIFEPDLALYKVLPGSPGPPEPDRYVGSRRRGLERRRVQRRPLPADGRVRVAGRRSRP